MTMIRLTAVLIAALFCSTQLAFADGYNALNAVATAFTGVHSYHADIAMETGQQFQLDFVAPNSYHEVMPGGMEMVIAPGSTKMKMNGKWMTLPDKYTGAISKGLDSTHTWASSNFKSDYKITDLGMDGSFHKYQFVGKDTTSFIWVRHDNLPDHMQVQSQGHTMTIRYSQYNEPIAFPS